MATFWIPFRFQSLRALLERGQERYDIFCSPCHDRLGTATAWWRDAAFKIPADLNCDRVREVPPGYLFQVISNGYGGHAGLRRSDSRVRDRWAIVAYIRALELSRHAPLADVPPAETSATGGLSDDSCLPYLARICSRDLRRWQTLRPLPARCLLLVISVDRRILQSEPVLPLVSDGLICSG